MRSDLEGGLWRTSAKRGPASVTLAGKAASFLQDEVDLIPTGNRTL